MSPALAAYADSSLNFIYNLLFADDAEPFRAAAEGRRAALFDAPPDAARLAEIAADETVEARLRVIAFRRLSEARGGGPPVAAPLLGVIVEIGLAGGLDTLAAYADRGVRYLNQGGGMTIAEVPELVAAPVAALLAAGRAMLPTIAEPTAQRLPPPTIGRARVTLLLGDRQHVTEDQYSALEHDEHAGPVLRAALTLLVRLVAMHESSASAGEGPT